MPYFDDFDLSTVDLLLISQYVPPIPLSNVAFGNFGHSGKSTRRQWMEVRCISHLLDYGHKPVLYQ